MNIDAFRSLEEIINSGLEETALPYIKGNSIRIKHIVVRKSKNGWLVYNSKTHAQVARLFAKASAVAMAKSLAEGKSRTTEIIELDKIIQKNYVDCMFYKNTLKKCADTFKKAVTESRYESSLEQTERAKHSLDQIIFRY